MQTNRRNWLKNLGLTAAAIGFSKLQSLAAPLNEFEKNLPDDFTIRLNANENPYGPSSMAKTAFSNQLNKTNRYNWQLTSDLKLALAQKHLLTPENILLGAGSTEIIDLVVRFAAKEKGSFVIAEPSYGYWTDTAQKIGLKKILVPTDSDKNIDLKAMLQAIQTETKLVYICNPNNPTGTVCKPEELIDFISEATKKTLVLIDEAYLDYTNLPSAATFVLQNENLILTKTFSKIYGLAGARIGYAIAHASTIAKLSELQSWVNGSISVGSLAAAIASLNDAKFLSNTYTANEKTKSYTINQLQKLQLQCIPSASNFIYFSLENYKKDFFKQLKDNNIIGTRIYEEQGQWTRITIGTGKEMQNFISAMH